MSASMMHHVRSLSDTPALPMREFRGTGACATTVPAPAAPAVAMEASIDIDNSTFMKRSLSSGNMRPREGAEVPVSSLLGSHAAGKSFASLESVIKVTALIVAWYTFSSVANNTSKSILTAFPDAMTLTLSQLGSKVLYSFLLCVQVGKWKMMGWKQLVVLVIPLGLSNFFASWLTQLATIDLSVSFAQTIKATSPIFTVFLSFYFLKDRFTPRVVLSLLPIVIGVSLCTASELHFSLKGFILAMLSTLVFVLQNIYSKKLFKEHNFDHTVLVFLTSAAGFLLLLPVWIVSSALSQDTQPYSSSFGDVSTMQVVFMFVVNGLAHFMQTLSAFHALKLVSTTTYSIANTFKRVFVICVSVLWFGNEVNVTNAAGIALAIGGVWLYNNARQAQRRAEAAVKRGEQMV